MKSKFGCKFENCKNFACNIIKHVQDLIERGNKSLLFGDQKLQKLPFCFLSQLFVLDIVPFRHVALNKDISVSSKMILHLSVILDLKDDDTLKICFLITQHHLGTAYVGLCD